MSGLELKRKIREWDTERWRNDKEGKTTLAVYNQFKKEICDEEIYINDHNSVLLYRCRSNTLKLGWRNRFVGGDVGCRVCGSAEPETVEHFLLECDGLGEVRELSGVEATTVGDLLLFGGRGEERVDEYRRYIGRLWSRRAAVLKQREEQPT